MAKQILDVPVHPVSKFSEGDKPTVLVTEASTLMPRTCDRVWADASDLGFKVRLDTGEVVLFVLAGEMRSAEGELIYEAFVSHGRAGVLSALVYND